MFVGLMAHSSRVSAQAPSIDPASAGIADVGIQAQTPADVTAPAANPSDVMPITAPAPGQRPTVQGPSKGPVAVAARPAAPRAVAPRVVARPAVRPPVAARPAARPQARAAAAPRLPSTGTGGLLDQQSSNSLTGWALGIIVAAALGISAVGIWSYRRVPEISD